MVQPLDTKSTNPLGVFISTNLNRRNGMWVSPKAAVVPNFHLPMRSLEVKNRLLMTGAVRKFFVASMFMWVIPVAILYGFNHDIFLGSIQLSSSSKMLLSGFLAVISVNVVIAFYICMAMKEPSDRHQPDPAFLADAKASINQSVTGENEESSQSHDKQE